MHGLTSMSRRESGYADGFSRFDHQTAHNAIGDAGHKVWLPDSCSECFKQAEEASLLGWEPTYPDQEIPAEFLNDHS